MAEGNSVEETSEMDAVDIKKAKTDEYVADTADKAYSKPGRGGDATARGQSQGKGSKESDDPVVKN